MNDISTMVRPLAQPTGGDCCDPDEEGDCCDASRGGGCCEFVGV